jgi:hypothetical protein
MNDLISFIYVYCTDFTINAANLLRITYEDFNALIFLCVMASNHSRTIHDTSIST